MILPVKPFKKMLKEVSRKRVSHEAAEILAEYVEKKVSELLIEANKLAEHAGRKTVLVSDVKLAKKKLNL